MDSLSEFSQQVQRASGLVFRISNSVLRNREDAEDVTQEAFIRAFAALNTLKDRERFQSWVARTAWRLALNRHRSNTCRLRRETEAALRPAPSVRHGAVIAQERSQRLWRAIDALPENLRTVVILAYIEERELVHVCRELNIPKGTAKSRLFRARHRL